MARAKQQEKRQVYRWPLHRPGFNLVGASAGAASADLCTIHSILLATVEAGERSEAAAAPEKKECGVRAREIYSSSSSANACPPLALGVAGLAK